MNSISKKRVVDHYYACTIMRALNYACTIIGGSMKGADWEKY